MRIAYRIILVTLVLSMLFLGGLAKDYKEKIVQYEFGFKLPDKESSTIAVNKTATSGETLDGTPYDEYSLNLQISGTDRTFGLLWITHYGKTWEMSLDKAIEGTIGIGKGNGYTACNSAHRTIDDHDGFIVNCFGSERNPDNYVFGYQLNNRTIVAGSLFLDWDTAVLPFLKSLHVQEM